jgi:hypothetical protein
LVAATGALLIETIEHPHVARPPWDLSISILALTGGVVIAFAGLYVVAAEVERFARGASADRLPIAQEE